MGKWSKVSKAVSVVSSDRIRGSVASLYPRMLPHIGITVTSIEKAIQSYHDILGFHVVGRSLESSRRRFSLRPDSQRRLGRRFRGGRLAQLAGGSGVCIELFDFSEPASDRRENNLEYSKTGINHFTIADAALEDLARRIAESGGKLRGQIRTLILGKPYKLAYCEDPFGNIIELYSHGTEPTWTNL